MLASLVLFLIGALGVTAFVFIPGWLGIALGIAGGLLIWCATLAAFKRAGWF